MSARTFFQFAIIAASVGASAAIAIWSLVATLGARLAS